ncbi:fibrillin-2 isoform X2 [Hydra vulgaris]|uniref:fibrillin-2 isoform X2 n=1 Tax=Hydra vulgaris TaxID=6087 RepID=UPI0032EA6784
MIHFENNNRSSCNLFQTLWNDVDKICNTESIVTECVNWIDYCNWTNSDYVNTNSCYNSTCTPVCFVDINECKNWIDYCNLANSDCVNINGSDNSTCESGWSLENNSFVVVNKSNELDKWTNSDCENINEIYNCTCKSGWSLVKDRCVGKLQVVHACEKKQLEIHCNTNEEIEVIYANYGRTVANICPAKHKKINCNHQKVSYDVVQRSCSNKSSCVVEATNARFGDPCKGTYKYLEVHYNCISKCENLTKYCNKTNGDCVHINKSFNCTCINGWRLENNSCADVNECNESAKYCNWTNSDCINTNGSYNCTCKFGWRLKNNSCVDVNECNESAEYCNWTNSDCINTNGSYNCTCKFGWRLENNSCVDINECDSLTDICNSTNTVCVNSIGSYYCYNGEWNTWSECSETCGSGYKYSILNAQSQFQQEAKRSLSCMNKKCSVDGNWSNWTTYKSCSNLCGICFTKQERYCNNPVPDGGHDCFGNNVQYHENNTICRVNGGWTQWSSWSLCSQPCQGGVKTRYRSCKNPVPKYGGLPCNGNNTDKVPCYSDKCKNVTVNFGIFLTDEGYIAQYSDLPDKVYKSLEDKIKTAIGNVYNKFNKTVPFNLKLSSIKYQEIGLPEVPLSWMIPYIH